MDRLAKFFDFLKAQKIDGLILNDESNVSYAAGFSAPDAYALLTPQEIVLVTDARYEEDFKTKAAPPVNVAEFKASVFKTLASCIKREGLARVGFESRRLPFAEAELFHRLLKKYAKLIPLKETLEPLREVKNDTEIAKIRRAVAITLKTYAFLEKYLKAGMKELDIAAEIERFVRREGASATAFGVIVASGPNSSYPHAAATRRPIEKGEPVIIDMGVVYDGYRCDLTRTFFLGKIKKSIVRRAAGVVREAQRRAIRNVKAGVPAKALDAAARSYIAQEGFGKNFCHALGHGVGLETHELPAINKKNSVLIKENSVFTIEPGIYFPGDFGIRMEEMVLATRNGAEVLSGNDRY